MRSLTYGEPGDRSLCHFISRHIGLVTSPLVAGRLAQTSVYSMGAFFTLLWAGAAGALLLLMCMHRSSARRYQRGVA